MKNSHLLFAMGFIALLGVGGVIWSLNSRPDEGVRNAEKLKTPAVVDKDTEQPTRENLRKTEEKLAQAEEIQMQAEVAAGGRVGEMMRERMKIRQKMRKLKAELDALLEPVREQSEAQEGVLQYDEAIARLSEEDRKRASELQQEIHQLQVKDTELSVAINTHQLNERMAQERQQQRTQQQILKNNQQLLEQQRQQQRQLQQQRQQQQQMR